MFINLEIERLRHRLTRAELSDKLSVSVTTLDAWTYGRLGIPADKLRTLTRLFDCSIDYLLKEQV